MDAERIAEGWLKTNSIDYWLDICARALRICDNEEDWCKAHGLDVPAWVGVRRREYLAMDEALCKRLEGGAHGKS